MIQNFWILATAGIPIVEKSYGELQVDSSLISGFLMAINNFAEETIGGEIHQMQAGGYSFVFEHTHEHHLTFILIVDENEDPVQIKNLLREIRNGFYALHTEALQKMGKIFRAEEYDYLGDDADKLIRRYNKGSHSIKIPPAMKSIAKTWINLGIKVGQEGELHQAINYFKKSVQTEPDNPSAYQYLALAYRGIGDWQEAKACMQKSIEAYERIGQDKAAAITRRVINRMFPEAALPDNKIN